MILAKDDIEKAVSWWAGKLMDHQPHSNGDDSFTSVAVCFLADTIITGNNTRHLIVRLYRKETGMQQNRRNRP